MLYENTTINQNSLILSLKPSTSEHKYSTFHNIDSNAIKHWETIEKYYVDRLNSLKSEIDNAIIENNKLSLMRNDLLQEIVKLTQQSIDLNKKQNNENSPVTSSLHSSSNISSSVDEQETIKLSVNNHKPGLFRQLSQRLSTKRKKQVQSQPEEQINIVPINSSSEPLIHPAAVVNSHSHSNYSIQTTMGSKFSMFGNDLVQQARIENSIIPSIVLKCVSEIESRGLNTVGIYRKSGTMTEVKELEQLFNENKDPKISKIQDIHSISSLLKSYLRSLPNPLISNDFILHNCISNQERINKTSTLLYSLPPESYNTIKLLARHLKRVHQNQSVNRMSSKNLAVVLGPTLMKFNNHAGNEEQQMRDMIQTIDFLILQSHLLFADHF